MNRITFLSTIGAIGLACFFIIVIGGDDCDSCYSPAAMAIRFLICGLTIITGSIYFTKKFLKTEGLIFKVESQPILKTDEAVDGVSFAGEGIIESDGGKLLTSPYTNTQCVYFHSIKEQLVRSGKSRYWKIIANMALFVPFYLKDKRGKLKIDLTNLDFDFSNYKIPLQYTGVPNPKNSEIDCDVLLKKSLPLEGSSGFFSSLTNEYRVSEFVLQPGTPVFVYGAVSRKNEELALGENERHPLIISKKGRDRYVEEFYRGGKLGLSCSSPNSRGLYACTLFSKLFFTA